MSAYKKLNQQDAFITTYTARKSWIASGSQYGDLGILNIVGLSGSRPYYSELQDIVYGGGVNSIVTSSFNRRLTFHSTHHLYYSLFNNSEILTSSSYENYLQSSYNISGSRYLNERIAVLSLPKEMYGTHIEPGSVSIRPDLLPGTGSNYILNNYVTDAETDPNGTSSDPEDNLYIENIYDSILSTLGVIVDDGEGNLYLQYNENEFDYIENESDYVIETEPIPGQYLDQEPVQNFRNRVVGNVIYSHGQIIITDDEIAMYYNYYVNAIISWKSNQPIYTHNYHCKIKTAEFNHTLNKTALDTTTGEKKANISGSYFQPYITTVGLYNDVHELVAVAKMGQPLPTSADTDMSIIVKLDMNFGVNRFKQLEDYT